MYNETILESLIQGIYTAAISRTGWPAFLSAFAQAIDSSHPSFYLADTATSTGSIEVSVGMDDATRRSYREHYVHRNVWIQRARPLLSPGSIRSSDRLYPRQAFLRSEWYADFCRPLGWTRAIGATLLKEGTTTANIGAFRGDDLPEFAEAEFTLLRALMPHLQQGLRLYRRLAESRAHGQALEAVLHALGTPAILAAMDGTVLFMNAAAEALIRTSDGLLVVAGRLHALLPEQTAALNALIRGCMQIGAGTDYRSGGNLSIARPYGRRALEVLVSPLPGAQEQWLLRQRAVAAIFASDPAPTAIVEDSHLIRRHGLTASEARVALALARGLAGKQVCRALDISYNTLKTHLKHIYSKTGTKHQSDLVRLLSSSLRLHAAQGQSPDR